MELTLQQLWDDGRKRLEEAGVAECDLDARYLLMEAFHIDAAHFLIKRREPLEMENPSVIQAEKRYRSWIRKRAERIPLQYLTGRQEFMGLTFYVNEHVLIPRQDTETLVELVMKRCPSDEGKNCRLLDMCTGSGCIGVSLFVLGGYREVTAADISVPALEVAYRNAADCMAGSIVQKEKGKDVPWRRELIVGESRKFTFIQSDLFQNVDKSLKYDIIVSNPPYIATDVIQGLEPEVRQYEPRLALDGAEDGLYFYRRLAEEAREHLTDRGSIFFEIGYDQGEAVTELLEKNGFRDIEIIRDSAGLDRVAHGRLEMAGRYKK